MKRKMLTPLMLATVSLFWNVVVHADEFNRDSYVKSVITVLNIHADILSNLPVHQIKYSDNLVRHANALEQTFDLLGPMTLHAAKSATLMKAKDRSEGIDAQVFERLSKNSNKAMKEMVRAAHRRMDEDGQKAFLAALDKLKNTCNSCHAYLPSEVAPDVWGTLNRE